MAELLQILAEQYDYPQLADEILRQTPHKTALMFIEISAARNSTITTAKDQNQSLLSL